jgi:hypothetical protein
VVTVALDLGHDGSTVNAEVCHVTTLSSYLNNLFHCVLTGYHKAGVAIHVAHRHICIRLLDANLYAIDA